MHALRDIFWPAATHNFVVRALYKPGHCQFIADCISRLHEPRQFNCLESIINEWYLCHAHKDKVFDQYSMLNHMSISSLCSVLKQVQLWRQKDHDLKWTWRDTAKQLMPLPPRQRTKLNWRNIYSFVISWVTSQYLIQVTRYVSTLLLWRCLCALLQFVNI